MITKFTPEKIESYKQLGKLGRCPMFVFGSNIQGEHVGGAAYFALKECRAVANQGFGFQGSSYAIPTCIRLYDKQGKRYTKPFDNVNQIKPYVDAFINDADTYPNTTFFVTKIGCGIAGFKVSEVAELFRPCLEMENVILPKEFVEWLLYPVVIDKLHKRGLVGGGVDYVDSAVMKYVMNNIELNSLDILINAYVEKIKK